MPADDLSAEQKILLQAVLRGEVPAPDSPLDRLGNKLAVAREIRASYQQGDMRQRYAAMKALEACHEYIKAISPPGENLGVPLLDLLQALQNLENGVAESILAPTPVAGGRPVSETRKTFQGQAAAIMGGLMKYGGLSRRKAAVWVASRMVKAGYDVTPTTIRNWRKAALEAPNEWQGQRYAAALAPDIWGEPMQRAEQLMQQLTILHQPPKR